MGIQAPTKIRTMSIDEYHIVSDVFGSTLPSRQRILVTNAAGLGGRAFTIPSLIFANIFTLSWSVLSHLGTIMKAGYLMNVGGDYNRLVSSQKALLVHETAHVWQGYNSSFALSYVLSSVINQVLHGSDAYSYTAGQPWKSYNAEQQASIVEDWFRSGMPQSGDLWPYIDNNVRKGDA